MSVESPAPPVLSIPSRTPKRRVWTKVAAVLFWVGALVGLYIAVVVIWHVASLPCSVTTEYTIRIGRGATGGGNYVREEEILVASILFLATGLFSALGWFFWRSRFSLRTLVILVMASGALATLPELLRPRDEVQITIHASPEIPASSDIPPPDVKAAFAFFPPKLYRRIGFDPECVRILEWKRLPDPPSAGTSSFLLRLGFDATTSLEQKLFVEDISKRAVHRELAKATHLEEPETRLDALLCAFSSPDLRQWCDSQRRILALREDETHLKVELQCVRTDLEEKEALLNGREDWNPPAPVLQELRQQIRMLQDRLDLQSNEIRKLEAEADHLLDPPLAP